MKKNNYIYSKITLLLGLILIVGCERDPSDEVAFATYPKSAEVFIDGFSGGLNYFPFSGSKANAFTVDLEVKYKGTASMRFDVPTVGNPDGAFAGAIFPDATGRDLSGYDALTFWIKSTQAATLNEVGFGNDFGENKYLVTMNNVPLSTNWTKVIIPLPDATKLTLEKGMFWYAEGPENGNGYTFWIDELKFEKLGTIAQPRPAILDGLDKEEQSFTGARISLTGLTQTFNLSNGINQKVTVAPNYYRFKSSNIEVARVSELGVVSVVGAGTAKITAMLGNVAAQGSLTINSVGNFTRASVPTVPAANVISIFSNAYTNRNVEYYNGYWQFSTTQGEDNIDINGDKIIKYSELNFVGIQFTKPTVDVSQMTHFHIDIQVIDPIPAGGFVTVKLQDIGADNAFGGSDDAAGEIKYMSPTLVTGSWVSIDVPLSSFSGLTTKSNLAQVVLVSDATIKNILVDNIYFYKQ